MTSMNVYSKEQIDAKIPATTSASAGDVLTLDSNKDAVWQAPSGGSGGHWETVDMTNPPRDFQIGDKVRITYRRLRYSVMSSISSWTSTFSLSGNWYITDRDVATQEVILTDSSDAGGAFIAFIERVSQSTEYIEMYEITINNNVRWYNNTNLTTYLNSQLVKCYCYVFNGAKASRSSEANYTTFTSPSFILKMERWVE